jgi:uncharacterized protein involved in tolerance to divalent cations
VDFFDNFISYRRSDAEYEANKLYELLANYGHSVFCDQQALHAGDFSLEIQTAISGCKNFILLATFNSLIRCRDSDDWVRKEIELALQKKKNIVILFLKENFRFPESFPEEISDIKKYNGIPFFDVDNRHHINRLIYEFLKYDRTITNETDFVIEGDILVRFVGTAPIIEIPNGIRVIGKGAFNDATKVLEIYFPDSVIEIGTSAFERCRALTVIRLPKKLRTIRKNAFRRCVALHTIYFNDELVDIEPSAFEFCTALRVVKLPKSLLHIDPSALNNCISLYNIEVDRSNPIYSSEAGILFSRDKKTLVRCPESLLISELPQTVEIIGRYAFYKSRIDTLSIKRKLLRIEDSAFQQAQIRSFSYQQPLPEEIGASAFAGCEHLKHNPFVIRDKRERAQSTRNIKPFLILFQYVIAVTTFESEDEAKNMTAMLLNKKLIVAGQIRNVRSIYSWNNEICDEEEYELSCITEGRLYPDVEAFIVENHSYDLCQIYCTPMINTTNEWGQWISNYLQDTQHNE